MLNNLDFQEKTDLVKLLLECPSIKDAAILNSLLAQLPPYIQKAIKKHDIPQVHVLNIVDSCLNYKKFDSLIEVLRFFDGETKQFKELTDFINPPIDTEKTIDNSPQTTEIYDVFLSYAKADIELSQKLANHLRNNGVKVWFDEWVLKGGDHKGTKEIEGLKSARQIVVILTPRYFYKKNSERFSMVVNLLTQQQTETLAKERPLIPLLFQACKINPFFQHFHPIDFTNEANFNWAARQLLDVLNVPRPHFSPKSPDNLPDYGVDDLRERSKGETFVDAVAKLYRLCHYTVQSPIQWDGIKFDLSVVAKKDLGIPHQALVTCIDGYCSTEHVHEIATQHQQVQNRADYQWTVLSAQGFSQDSYNQLKKLRINCITYAELLNQLVPLKPYVDTLINDYKHNIVDTIWAGNNCFIPPDICTEIEEKTLPALDHIAQWRGNSGENLITILGDLGTGKTILANYLAFQWGRAFQDNPLHHPAPVLIPLKEIRKAITLESIITSHFNRQNLGDIPYPHFEHLLRLGKVVLLFDGFDEMADRIRYDTMRENFRELARAAEHNSKVILTCRTQYFRDRNEQVKIIGGTTFAERDTELYKDLRQYGNRQQVIFLQLFDDQKIRAYLQRVRPEHFEADWNKIQHIYDMKGLAKRPLLLDMIVKTLPQFKAGEHISVARLYKLYTNQWVEREDEKQRLLDPPTRLQLMLELAWKMWDTAKNSLTYRKLLPFVTQLNKIMDFDEEPLEVITRELQTATFLKREKDDRFSFMHRSFMEYFLARKIHAALEKSDLSVLDTRRFDQKVVYFLTQMGVPTDLAAILSDKYQSNISENALQILYWSRRINAGMEEKITDLAKLQQALQFPADVQLQKAQLSEIILEGAVLPKAQLRGANLFKANLNNSDFQGSDFQQADLRKARCLKANFMDCNFIEAKLEDVDFREANLRKTVRKDFKIIYDIGSYPERDRLIALVQRGHNANVNAIDYSHDGNCFATACSDSIIRIWHSTDYRLLYTLEGHQSEVWSVAFNPSGGVLASGSSDKTVRLWDVNTVSLKSTLEGHQSEVWSVAFDPGGAMLASGSSDKTVRLWDVNTASLKSTLEGHQSEVWSVAFDPSRAVLASGSSDKTVRLWDVNTASLKSTLEGHQSKVRSVAFDPSGVMLASGSSDKTVRLWDVNTASLKSTLEGHQSEVWSVAFDPSGVVLASGSSDKTVRLWDVNTASLKSILEGHQGWVRSVAFDPSKAVLASGSRDSTVRLWDVNTASLKSSLKGHQYYVRSVAFDPSRAVLVTGGNDNTVRLWDVNTANLKSSLKGHQSSIGSVAFDPSGAVLASGSRDSTVRLWDVNTASLKSTLEGHQGWVRSVAFDPSGVVLASGSDDNTVRLWDVNTTSLKSTLEGQHQSGVWSVAFDPSGAVLASGSRDSTVRLWNVNTASLKSTLEGHQGWVWSVAFDPSGAMLASGSRDSTVRLWDVNTASLKSTLEGHQDSVWSVAFDPSRAVLASGSSDNTVRLWNLKTVQCLAVLRGHLGSIYSVAFAPNGHYLVAAGRAGRLQFWDIKTYKTFLYRYHFGPKAWLDLLPDGRFNASPEGMRSLCYTEKGTFNSYTAEELVKVFYDPEGVQEVLARYV